MVSLVNSMGMFGMNAFMVEVEADVTGGKFRFDLVGLPDTAVTESRERVVAAVKNSGCAFPYTHITVNLAPADVKKEGSLYDLPILIAVLQSSRQLRCDVSDCAFLGELSLSGQVRGVSGVLPMVIEARNAGIRRVFVSFENAAEAAVVDKIEVYGVRSVTQLLAYLRGEEAGETLVPTPPYEYRSEPSDYGGPDFADVVGQAAAKRAMEVAAAGGHNLLMVGSPGSGKSMLAKRLPTILPDMTFEESLETTKIYSVAGLLTGKGGLITERPFRSPHHTVSNVALVGGGTIPHPGEISLAHNGVLFLDEFPEFSSRTMDTLRQPLEDGVVTISRASGTVTFPSSLMLVGAMNPCPCGYAGHPVVKCRCTPLEAQRYFNRLSGPLLDRIDIQISVPPVEFSALSARGGEEESSAEIKKRVDAARAIQQERFAGTSTTCNARMKHVQIRKYCRASDAAMALLKNSFDRLGLSARAYDKILKLARTIADLDASDGIEEIHMFEAIRYRCSAPHLDAAKLKKENDT